MIQKQMIWLIFLLAFLLIGCSNSGEAKKTCVGPIICDSLDPLECFDEWLIKSKCFSGEFADKHISNPIIIKETPLTKKYTFDFFDASTDRIYCLPHKCYFIVATENGVLSIKNVYIDIDNETFPKEKDKNAPRLQRVTSRPIFKIDIDDPAPVQCGDDLVICFGDWLATNTNYSSRDRPCEEFQGCNVNGIGYFLHSPTNLEDITKKITNVRETKHYNQEIVVAFEFESNNYTICNLNPSLPWQSCRVFIENINNKLQVNYIEAALREYNISIDKFKAKEIFDSSKDCKTDRLPDMLLVIDRYRKGKYTYDRDGIHWQIFTGLQCGRTCFVNAETGELRKGKIGCI